MELPAYHDFVPGPGETLDERRAVQNFLGKSLEQASALFFENALLYDEDLMWMGGKAFAFYLPAVLPYLRSAESEDDPDFVSSLLGTLQFRWKYDRPSVELAKEAALEVIRTCLQDLPKFDTAPEIYRRLPERLREWEKKLESLG